MNNSDAGTNEVEKSSEINYDYDKHSLAVKHLIKSLYHLFVLILRERGVLPMNHFVNREQTDLGYVSSLNRNLEISKIIIRIFKSLKHPVMNNFLKSFSLTLGEKEDPSIIFEEFRIKINYGLIENLQVLTPFEIKTEVRRMLRTARVMCFKLKELPGNLTASFQADYTPDAPVYYQLPQFITCDSVDPGKVLKSVEVILNGGYHRGEISVWSQFEADIQLKRRTI